MQSYLHISDTFLTPIHARIIGHLVQYMRKKHIKNTRFKEGSDLMKYKLVKRAVTGILVLMLVFTGMAEKTEITYAAEKTAEGATEIKEAAEGENNEGEDKEEKPYDTVDFRVLATGDIHGQFSSYNCETAEEIGTAGLTKIYTLIKKQRSAAGGAANTVTVDAGDCMYDYFSDYYYEKDASKLQPVYKAMAKMGYDVIVPGNHDWDYSYEYLKMQYKESGLESKVAVCNAFDNQSGESLFAPYKIITKKAKTALGNTVTLKIGIIGATRETLSGRRAGYQGIIDGESIYTNVKKQASILKNTEKCDLVIAVIHGGIGVLKGADTNVHPGGRLAALSTIDGVVTSHSHELFPSKDETYKDYTYVDNYKGTVYGKPVVGTSAHATYLGVMHYTFNLDEEGKMTLAEEYSENIPVTSKIKENSGIKAEVASYEEIAAASISKSAYEIAEGISYTNMDCVVKDSNLYQLMNDSKIKYAKSYISEYRPDLENYPVIAVSVNYLDSGEDFINISGSITEKDVAKVLSINAPTRDSGYLHLYTIKGSKLLEWIEYSASIYAQNSVAVLPAALKKSTFYSELEGVSPLISSKYAFDWSNFFIFDGISYQIDNTQPARYNENGTVKNYSAHRVKNLKYQGKSVTGDQEFVIAMDSLNQRYSFMPEDSTSLFTTRTWVSGKEVLMAYIKEQSYYGPLNITADDNWRIIQPEENRFTITIPKANDSYITSTKWYSKLLYTKGNYNYYLGNILSKEETKQRVHVIASEGIITETSQKIPIIVTATTAPGSSIKKIEYVKGNNSWSKAKTVNGNVFYVKMNGHYKVKVTDSAGRVGYGYVTVNNYNESVLDTPRLGTITNRVALVNGVAVPGATIYIAAQDGTIVTGIVPSSSGSGVSSSIYANFSITIPLARAYEKFTIWASKNGITSNVQEVKVKKTGANQPVVDTIEEGALVITGTCDKYTTISARVGKKVYVAKGEKEAYKASSVYNSSHKIYEKDVVYTDNGDGTVSFSIPMLTKAKKDTVYYVYATDRNGNASRAYSAYVQAAESEETGVIDETASTEISTNEKETSNAEAESLPTGVTAQ